jgi:hypothetical protein
MARAISRQSCRCLCFPCLFLNASVKTLIDRMYKEPKNWFGLGIVARTRSQWRSDHKSALGTALAITAKSRA